MAKILSETDEFSADVTVPEDGDAANAASVEPAFQKLTNRTHNLLGRIAGERRILIPLSACRPIDGTETLSLVSSAFLGGTTAAAWVFSSSPGKLLCPIHLPPSAALTRVEFLVQQGSAGSDGQMSASVYRDTASTSTGGTSTVLGSSLTFTAGAGFRNAGVNIATNNVAGPEYMFYAIVSGSSLAASASDFLFWVAAEYTSVSL